MQAASARLRVELGGVRTRATTILMCSAGRRAAQVDTARAGIADANFPVADPNLRHLAI